MALTEITVLTSNSTQPVLEALAHASERETGNRVDVQFESARVMLSCIKEGRTGDLVVLGAGAIDELVALGHVNAATVRPFARSRVGVAVKRGCAHPDISTVDAFRRALLDARSVAHTVHGASGMYVPTLLERLGIGPEVAPKTVTRPGGFIGHVVASGEAEIAIQQISELLAVPGVELVGALPDEIEKVFLTAAGVLEASAKSGEARALLDFFSRPECAPIFEARGLELA